jgi:disulfide oxidoreductase YuzD
MNKSLFKSKTKFKQYNLYLQKLSKKITEINLDYLKKKKINETILKEVENYSNINKKGSKKRQLLYISKLFRNLSFREIIIIECSLISKGKLKINSITNFYAEMLIENHDFFKNDLFFTNEILMTSLNYRRLIDDNENENVRKEADFKIKSLIKDFLNSKV